jgi:3-isopropylmalate/(R)-2-methylmalate dehydratase small subunit
VTPEPFTVVTGRAVPLLLENLDTDVIIPVERMVSTDPAALAHWAFESLRYDSDGRLKERFVLNDPAYSGAPFLVAGENFGCGSSREPAVWALMGLGFRCVIAPSFGEIFEANCLTNGLLPVRLHHQAIEEIAAAGWSLDKEVTVDLATQEVWAASRSWDFEISRAHKHMLLNGFDEMALGISHLDQIESWERRDRQQRRWAWPAEPAEAPVP